MSGHIRRARPEERPRISEIRFAVRENQLLDPSRVTDADYHWFSEHPGIWVWEEDGRILGFSAADTRRQLSLHAVALAALQQDQDTPNSGRDEYCYSAPHSLKYSAVPSPASTLQGLQVNSFDTTELAELAASRGRMLSIDEGEGAERHTDNTDRGSSEMHSSYSSLPLRTHDDLNMLIPALRQLPGRSGFSSETSSGPEGGAHVYNNSGERSTENSFSRSTFNSKDVYLSSSITSSVGAETDGSFE